jgi:glycosyltransferase involved in cell wall biosynthesis
MATPPAPSSTCSRAEFPVAEGPGPVVFVVADLLSGENALSVRGQAIARALGAAGLPGGVVVVCGDHEKSFSADGVVVQKLARRLVKNDRPFAERIAGELALGAEMAAAIRRLQPAHVVLTTPPFLTATVVWSALKALRVPYTLDVRDLYPEVYARAGLMREGGRRYRAILALAQRMYAGATVLTTVTPDLQDYLAAMLPGRRVELVMNGYAEATFHPRDDDDDNNDEGPVVIVSHGNFGELFDLDVFATIARALAARVGVDYRIRIIGFGKKLEALKALALPHVEVLGPRDNAEMGALLRQAHIGLSVHKHYDEAGRAFPVKVFEFIGSGLPTVVIPRNEGGRAVVARGFGGSFEAAEVEAAIALLQRLIEDRGHRRAVAAAVRAGRAGFSLDGQVARLAAAVRAVVGTAR